MVCTILIGPITSIFNIAQTHKDEICIPNFSTVRITISASDTTAV